VERAGLLRGARRLIIVPHSVLAYLPFAALKREGTGHFLIEDYTLLHLPSAAALAVVRSRSPQPPASAQAKVFAPFSVTLPGSVREARAFQRVVPGSNAREGRRATEAEFRQALAGGGMVHLATHGVMNQRNPMFSRLELARGGGGSDDDGRLEVHELLALRIEAPLVFLSGCETGVGAAWSTQFARGEDYATLGQAMLYAGARTVVATLWQIGDEGAAVFAERFYVKLRSAGPAEALAEAQRELLKGAKYSSPYYWAAYQVIGEGEPLPGPHKPAALSVQRR
jgi:CHAT domain-containing protein